MDQKYERIPIFRLRRKLTYNHWLAALVKGKCSSTKPTRLATGVVCHPDTEQNRPYKIPWPCRGLNRGPTAPQERTLPVCHTTLSMHSPFGFVHLSHQNLSACIILFKFTRKSKYPVINL